VPTLTIDQQVMTFEPGETILSVATRAGLSIPTLCHLKGIEPPPSCYVCVVKIKGRAALAPSCATLAEEGMIVESETEEVRTYRKRALELLLSEHAGDCEGPCRRICPADLDIPVMASQIVAGDLDGAHRTVRERLALPGVLGHICIAPCEKGCVRAAIDGAVTIRELHKGVAEAAMRSGSETHPAIAPSSGKRVTILGAGPAGLSSAYYLTLLGHVCTIVDEREEPGGMLRYGCHPSVLPAEILDHEISVIQSLGVHFQMMCSVRDSKTLDALLERSDALLFATGALSQEHPWPFEITTSPKGITVDSKTFETSRKKIFACGNAVAATTRLAVRAVGQGRLAALSIHAFLTGQTHAPASSSRTDSRLGKLEPEELRQLVSSDLASLPLELRKAGSFALPLVESASRCLQCDCGKKEACALRTYSQEYEADRDHYRTGKRKQVKRKRYPSGLVHEPGKCIDCGRCIGITASEHAQPGLAFNNRGFDVIVKAPFAADMDTAMGPVLKRCIEACPVGALWDGVGDSGSGQ
jgi:ferredoxin